VETSHHLSSVNLSPNVVKLPLIQPRNVNQVLPHFEEIPTNEEGLGRYSMAKLSSDGTPTRRRNLNKIERDASMSPKTIEFGSDQVLDIQTSNQFMLSSRAKDKVKILDEMKHSF